MSGPAGPGESVASSPAGVAGEVRGPLGPGEDDPASPARGAAGELRGPLGPGEGGDDTFETITPAAATPGGVEVRRTLTRVPKQAR